MAQSSSQMKMIPELSVTRSTPLVARKPSRAFFRLSGIRSSISLRELRTIPRRGRNTPKDIFTPPISDREWWRVTLKETPVPGTYDIKDFLQEKEQNHIKPTYNFKGEGRKKILRTAKNGNVLLPGAYEYQDFLQSLDKLPLTYQFKSDGRRRELPGIKDRGCNVSPCQYHVDRKPVPKLPVQHGAFKSQSSRFPAKYFVPKEGPSAGSYDPKSLDKSPAISSSFKSSSPRFHTSQTRVPGPGTYAPTIQSPQPSTLMKMGRMHGLFFRNAFEV